VFAGIGITFLNAATQLNFLFGVKQGDFVNFAKVGF
jgi:hypothetical protein